MGLNSLDFILWPGLALMKRPSVAGGLSAPLLFLPAGCKWPDLLIGQNRKSISVRGNPFCDAAGVIGAAEPSPANLFLYV